MYGDLMAFKYYSTSDPKDIVEIDEIFRRYIQINETIDGFEEYVNSGFRNGNEIEYKNCNDMKDYVICFYNTETEDEKIRNTQGFTLISGDSPQSVADYFYKFYKGMCKIAYVAEVKTDWEERR